jgi:hypothetical protein
MKVTKEYLKKLIIKEMQEVKGKEPSRSAPVQFNAQQDAYNDIDTRAAKKASDSLHSADQRRAELSAGAPATAAAFDNRRFAKSNFEENKTSTPTMENKMKVTKEYLVQLILEELQEAKKKKKDKKKGDSESEKFKKERSKEWGKTRGKAQAARDDEWEKENDPDIDT